MQVALNYDSEKSPHRSADWSRDRGGRARLATPDESRSRARSPPKLRPAIICNQIHETKPTVPLRVWVLASASCFAVCAALVLATVAITKWGSVSAEQYPEPPPPPPPPLHHTRPAHEQYRQSKKPQAKSESLPESQPDPNEIHSSILEKLSMFRNFINRDNKKEGQKESLVHKPQYHPASDSSITHTERKIEKKDKAKHNQTENRLDVSFSDAEIPEFKPTLPDIFVNHTKIKLPDGYVEGLRKYDEEYYDNDLFYQDDPLYDDYAESNSMTNYLIEKIQELYEWVTTDPELEGVKNSTERIFRKKGENSSHNEFGQLLQALNESVIEGNVSIVMLKLKDLYFGAENFTNLNATHRTILKNTTDLLSFGMLTLDVMLLHNIQVMAWDTQESSGLKMLQDPEVFAFNALFMDPAKIETKRQEVLGYKEGASHLRRQEGAAGAGGGGGLLESVLELGLSAAPAAVHLSRASRNAERRQEGAASAGGGGGLLESVLELGLSAARAAVHLGRAYKNAKSTLKQISNRETAIQNHLARYSQSNARALTRLHSSYDREDAQNGGDAQNGRFSELDCVWFLYCRNLVATAKLASPFGAMARINGVALRMITGELAAEKALDTLLVEATTGWSELRCPRMLPRCSGGEAAVVVLESVVQPHRKSSALDRHRTP